MQGTYTTERNKENKDEQGKNKSNICMISILLWMIKVDVYDSWWGRLLITDIWIILLY